MARTIEQERALWGAYQQAMAEEQAWLVQLSGLEAQDTEEQAMWQEITEHYRQGRLIARNRYYAI